MTGMIWDELQRLKAALHSLDSDLQERHSLSDEWPRVIEAMSALEDAIVESWPPKPEGEMPVQMNGPFETMEAQRDRWEAINKAVAYSRLQIIANGLNPPKPRYYDISDVEPLNEEGRLAQALEYLRRS